MQQINTRAATHCTVSIDANRGVTRRAISRLTSMEPSRAPPTPRRRTTRFSESKPTLYNKSEQDEEEEENEGGETEKNVVGKNEVEEMNGEEEGMDDAADENEAESEGGDSEAEEFQPSADDSDEYAEGDEEPLISRTTGNARAVLPGPSSTRTGSAVANNDDSEPPNSSGNLPQWQQILDQFPSSPELGPRRRGGRRGSGAPRVS